MYMDQEFFPSPKLMDYMANVMLMSPPVQSVDSDYEDGDISLWSYGYDSGEVSSESKNQSVMIASKIAVQEDEEKEHQDQKLLYIMGIPIHKEQVALPQNETDPVHHSPDPELTTENATAAGDNKGHSTSSLPHHEVLENEGSASQQLSFLQLLFTDGNEQDEHVMDIGKSNSNLNSDEETSLGRTSRTSYNVVQIVHFDELEEESHIKCNKPQPLTSQPKRSLRVLIDEGNTMQLDHSALGTVLGETVIPEQHRVTAEGASHTLDDLAKEPLVMKDVGHAFRNEDAGYATTDASQHSRIKSIKLSPQQEVKDKTMVSDTSSAEKGMLLKDVISIEDDSTNIHIVKKRSIEDTSESEKQCEKDMSIENLSKHFGRPLVDAAKSFGVSRSTFKRICRGLGIERWQYGKRKMKSHSSSKLNRVNDEGLSIPNFSHLSMPPLQVRTVAQTNQEINVKATYNGVAIRFELLDSSGIAELEDNVIERLKLERTAFSIKFKDEEGDWVLIACDKDVQKCIKISRSLGKTIIKMLVDLPISHYGP